MDEQQAREEGPSGRQNPSRTSLSRRRRSTFVPLTPNGKPLQAETNAGRPKWSVQKKMASMASVDEQQ